MLIAELTAFAVIASGSGPSDSICCGHEMLWLQRPIATQVLHERMRTFVRRDFETIGARLRDRGVKLGGGENTIPVALAVDAALTADRGPQITLLPASRQQSLRRRLRSRQAAARWAIDR